MAFKEELYLIKEELKSIHRAISELGEKRDDKAKQLLNKVLDCKEALCEASWDLQGSNTLITRDLKHKMLADLLQTDYHCHYENDDMYLSFDDGDISLIFKTNDGALEFVKKYDIDLDVETLENQIIYLKDEVSEGQERLKKLEAEINAIKRIKA